MTDPHLVLSDRVPPRDLAVLLCNKSNAFFNLGKWNEAFLAAKECLDWDPTYVKVGPRGRPQGCRCIPPPPATCPPFFPIPFCASGGCPRACERCPAES